MAKNAAATLTQASAPTVSDLRRRGSKARIAAIIVLVMIVEMAVVWLALANWSREESAAYDGQQAAATGSQKLPSSSSTSEEVDLGQFNVASYQPASDTTLFISFHLFGTTDGRADQEIHRRIHQHKHRLRDQVIVIVRSAELGDLTDAGLGLIKRRILETVNKTLGKPLLQAVVFSDFSCVEQ